jgi:uncharacterized protein YecE (DUF72 family)
VTIRIGTAGWSIPRQVAGEFPAEGTALKRYAARFEAAEINSSFHRPHRESTWQRWHDSVPVDFRFSVKLPKSITHDRKLVDCADLTEEFLAQCKPLEGKLAVLLVQLPPRLAFDQTVAAAFFADLGRRTKAQVVCEPRHPSWFATDAEFLLDRYCVARVAADPTVCDAGAVPGGWNGLSYWRLHGSPVVYRSSYLDRIDSYAARIKQAAEAAADIWCIFDNTASSAGAGDALALARALQQA